MSGKDKIYRSSRRNFLGSAAAGTASAPLFALDPPEQGPFQPNVRPEKLSDNLFLFEDTCNVYLIRSGDHALLIDFGSGHILDHLADLQIARVDWILHTHHHRDQAQGDLLAVTRRRSDRSSRAGAPVLR